MRKFMLLGTAALLSACGGGSTESAGTVAPPTLGPQGPAGSGHTFVTPKEARSYQGVGGTHTLTYTVNGDDDDPDTPPIALVQGPSLYQGNASTARNSGIQVTYDPRDAIFSLLVDDSFAGANRNARWQDPAHRTDFGGARSPQPGVPNLNMPGMLYLQSGSREGVENEPKFTSDFSTFFYQKPGTTNQYVTLGGYLRNAQSIERITRENGYSFLQRTYTFERSAFAYGERSRDQDVPKTGTGTYNGSMIATMVFNDRRDIEANAPTYFQWLEGTSQMRVDFGRSTFEVDLAGRADTPAVQDGTSGVHTIRSGATFNANASGRVDVALQGGFLGDFQRAWFVNPDGQRIDLVIAGSSVNGAFFGPNGEEIGGGFRIVGGRPDERIDILGAFIGKK